MNNGNGPNPNSGNANAKGPFGNGFFVDGGMPPGLEALPPGLAALLEDMMDDLPEEESSKDEILEGTDEADSINGGPGNDTINGLGGDDDLKGGPGDDVINGGDGNDELKGGPGDDELNGDAGNDVLIAGPGNDLLNGGEGDDTYLFGGELASVENEGEEDEEDDEAGDVTSDEDGTDDDSEAEGGGDGEESGEFAAAKADNPGRGNGNGNGNGNAFGHDKDKDEDEDEDEEDDDGVEVSAADEDETQGNESESEEPEGDETEDESEDDGDTGLAWGENVIEDDSGNETIVFDNEARDVLKHEQDGQDLILYAGNGSLRVTGYFDDPDRWTFRDDLGEFDPTEGDEEPIEDPGDTPETAQIRPPEFETVGDVGVGDDAADYFTFTAPQNGDAKIELTGLSGPVTVRLLDNEGGVLSEGTVEGDDVAHVVPVEGGAAYFVEVTDAGGTGAEYALEVEFEPDLGDTFETATPIDELDGETTATVGFGDDSGDFAQLTPEGDGTLVVSIDGGDSDPTLTLYSGAGDVLTTGTDNGEGGIEFEFDLTGGETYVVGIEPNGGPSTYDVTTSYTVVPDESETPLVDEGAMA